jgi:hypothetical protein
MKIKKDNLSMFRLLLLSGFDIGRNLLDFLIMELVLTLDTSPAFFEFATTYSSYDRHTREFSVCFVQ